MPEQKRNSELQKTEKIKTKETKDVAKFFISLANWMSESKKGDDEIAGNGGDDWLSDGGRGSQSDRGQLTCQDVPNRHEGYAAELVPLFN